MTTARFEMREGVGLLVLADGDRIVELTPAEARSAFDLWHKHMRPLWDREHEAAEQAERDAINARYRQNEVRKEFGGPNGYEVWIIQMHPDFPSHTLSAWPATYGTRDAAPFGVGKSMTTTRPFQIEFRQTAWGGNTYMTDWGTARYATMDAAIRAAIRNRPAVMESYEASKSRNAARAA